MSTSGPLPSASQLLPVGDWLTDTTRTLVRGFGDYFAVVTVVAVAATAISAPLLWLSSADAIVRRDDDGAFSTVEGMTSGQGGMVAIGLLVSLLSQVVLFTGATNHIAARRAGESPAWQATFRQMLARSPRVLGVVIQVVLVALVLLTVAGVLAGLGLGGLGLVLAFVAIVVVWLRSAIASTHAALAQPGPSLRASFSWSRGLLWPLLGRHVLLMTLVFGLLLISSFFAAPFQSLAGAAPSTEGDLVLRELIGQSFPAFLAVQFINALASGVVAALWASAMLSLYRSEPAER